MRKHSSQLGKVRQEPSTSFPTQTKLSCLSSVFQMSSRTLFEGFLHSMLWTHRPFNISGKRSRPFSSATNSWSSAPSSSWAKHDALSTSSSPSAKGVKLSPKLLCWERGEKYNYSCWPFCGYRCVRPCVCVHECEKISKNSKACSHIASPFKHVANGSAHLFSSARSVRSALLSPELGIMLIIHTIH